MKLYYLATILQAAVQGGAVIGYYAPWNNVTVSELNLDGVTHVNYAFGLLINKKKPYEITFSEDKDLEKLIELKKKAGTKTKVLLSIGGWTAGQTFSLIARNDDYIDKFIKEAIKFIDGTGEVTLDGLDLDWEYPVKGGAACNEYHLDDSQNYLKLLDKLHLAVKAISSEKLLTAAVHVRPFVDGKNGNKTMTNVTGFAQRLDFINVMAYDLFGGWSETSGSHSQFRTKIESEFSYANSIQAWIDAGFKPEQINGGLAFYGRSFITEKEPNVKIRMKNLKANPQGDSSDSTEKPKICKEEWTGKYSGTFKYNLLRKEVFDDTDSPKNGYKYYWDEDSLTPYLYNQEISKLISYENQRSLKIKTYYAICKKIMGVMIWDLTTDYNNELLNTIVEAKSVDEKLCSGLLNYDTFNSDIIKDDNSNTVDDQNISDIKEKIPDGSNIQASIPNTQNSLEMKKSPEKMVSSKTPTSTTPHAAQKCRRPGLNDSPIAKPPPTKTQNSVFPENPFFACLRDPNGKNYEGKPCSDLNQKNTL